MIGTSGTTRHTLTPALEAIGNLALQELNGIFLAGHEAAQSAHAEIELAPVSRKTGPFYRHFLPWRKDLVSRLADSYRRYFKLALAHRTRSDAIPTSGRGVSFSPLSGQH